MIATPFDQFDADSGPQEIVEDTFRQRVAAMADTLAPAARRVVQFIDQNRLSVLASSAAQLAASIGTSDATVVRTVQALGFDGLDDLRRTLLFTMDARSTPADNLRRTLAEVGASAARAIDVVLEAHREALAVLEADATRKRIADAAAILHPVRRINVFGIGPSAALARYAVTLLSRTGRAARTLDETGLSLADQMLALAQGEGLLLLAYSQPYREVSAVFREARSLSMPTVLITDSAASKLAQLAEVVVPVPRGRAERVALHGGTLVAVEALVLALAASAPEAAMTTLERLNDLRAAVAGKRSDVE
jgi:DNA-binding MurR/RpiR family transcriptional regulator